MDIDEMLLKIVAAALTRGQGAFTKDELFAAYQQVYADKVAGTFAELLLEGQLALRVDDEEEVRYIGLELADKINRAGDKFSDEEIAAAVEAFISSARPPKEQADESD
jgi:hypothetical protein